MPIPYAHLKTAEQRLLWLSHWMIHHANHLREKRDGLKVGGHQASCASMASIFTALYFSALRPQDRVAVKPHAAPLFHAMHYLAGHLPLEKLESYRGLGGAQSYPSRTKDADDVDFSTGSVGLGVAMTAFASLVQDYIHAKDWGRDLEMGRMVALLGDAELDEGNIYEALQEGWKHDLRNCWWIIDYNRQSLDGVVHEGLWERIEAIFGAFGWRVVRLKYGVLQRAAFDEPGGEKLRKWIDDCPNQLYSALTFQGGAAWRAQMLEDFGHYADFAALLAKRSDEELAELMTNLGGNCVRTMADAFAAVTDARPTCFLAYTIKGWGTPLAGHKDNHAGLMTSAQMAQWQERMGVPEGEEWSRFAAVEDVAAFEAFLASVPFFAEYPRRRSDRTFPAPALEAPADKTISTQMAFARLLDQLARGDSELAGRVVTTSPDVTVSTGLGAWVNRRKLFSRERIDDTFRAQHIASTQKWVFDPQGQHMELGIAEMNFFTWLAAAGLSHSLFGKRLVPIGAVYDPFVARGLNAMNYACYQGARFIAVGTPSGITLAPEGGAHQSINMPLIGMAQDGLSAYEPAFADELAVILQWALDHVQADDGGAVYLRLSTNPLEQPPREMREALRADILAGAYWLRPPGPNCELVIAYQGVIAPEAIKATGYLAEERRDIGVLAVTSAGRLHAGLTQARHERAKGQGDAQAHIERLLAPLPPHCRLVTVIDGHPATLSWLGGVHGHQTRPLGVERFGQTGALPDLYEYYGINARAIMRMARPDAAGRASHPSA